MQLPNRRMACLLLELCLGLRAVCFLVRRAFLGIAIGLLERRDAWVKTKLLDRLLLGIK